MRKNDKTQVVNRHREPFDVYIGRGSAFGNPFVIGEDGDRDEVIVKFTDFFYKKLGKPRFQAAVKKLKGKRLGCFCKPEEGFQGRVLCHGQIIAAYLEECDPGEVV